MSHFFGSISPTPIDVCGDMLGCTEVVWIHTKSNVRKKAEHLARVAAVTIKEVERKHGDESTTEPLRKAVLDFEYARTGVEDLAW